MEALKQWEQDTRVVRKMVEAIEQVAKHVIENEGRPLKVFLALMETSVLASLSTENLKKILAVKESQEKEG